MPPSGVKPCDTWQLGPLTTLAVGVGCVVIIGVTDMRQTAALIWLKMANKYRNVKVEIDGIVFDSKREAAAYQNFRALKRCGAIKELLIQEPFTLFASEVGEYVNASGQQYPAVSVGKYIADFVVIEKDGTVRVYDAKGVQTPVYKLKKKLFEACYPHLRIVEI